MVDTDSDSDREEVHDCIRTALKHGGIHIKDFFTISHSDEIFERWSSISVNTKKEAAQRMKVCIFWLPILLQPDKDSRTTTWALQTGLINKKNDLSMKHLHKIEALEAILRAVEKGTVKKDQTGILVWISNMFHMRPSEAFEDALRWLDRTGEPFVLERVMDFVHLQLSFTVLEFVFAEFTVYIKNMGCDKERTMMALNPTPPSYNVEKCEEMKKKGNESFQKEQYEDALRFYSKAIEYYPSNHIIYGNRALCYIRCKKYMKAVCDGKRAILVEPHWAKGHYRYCEALFSLGEFKMAIEANISARNLCMDNPDGIKDLEQQHLKFITEMAECKAEQPKKAQSKSTYRSHTAESRPQSGKPLDRTDPVVNAAAYNKVSQNKMGKKSGKNTKIEKEPRSTKDCEPSVSEISSKPDQADKDTPSESSSATKNIPENKKSQAANQNADDRKAKLCKELRCLVQDAHTALADLRSRNAEQAFSKALALLENTTPKELGLSTQDVLLLYYGRASALTEIGKPEELEEAQRVLEKIKSFEERTFQCLVFYAVGRVFVKENRFSVAIEQFSDSLQMIKNQIKPGKLTWPLTKEVVKETQPNYFKEVLESAIDICKFPPIPDAICRFEKCHGHVKAEIYFTDPDFKGFIRICCCQSCVVEYHMTCWKTLKMSSNEKDFLQGPCLTPDCVGKISSIKIFGPTGLVKCKFEVTIPKPQTQRKPKVNQKCTSVKKIKSKEERRLKRKQHKQTYREQRSISSDILQQKEDSGCQNQQKAWLVYKDRVLLQISQNIELLREEKSLHMSSLTGSLKPWLTLDSQKGNQLAMKLLHWEKEQLETVGQVIEILLERKNRVWARVFIQVLSNCVGINPKLYNWACQLNNAGLNASRCFLERYSGHLDQVDLSILLRFDPLQEVIIQNLGTIPELFSSIGLTVTEYLKQASAHDTRLFIWALEEHRDHYVSCQDILDEYFDMMDGPCSVIQKSNEDQNNSPIKSRSRKKKQKETKGSGSFCLPVILPGRRGRTPREEWDQDIFEDESLSFLHPSEPFSVPSHLREQVADFENQYNDTRFRSQHNILDNDPDPTKESLYDYFAQILGKHGPLAAEDLLLVGVAQNKIKEAGSLEFFLMESLRFIKIGRYIGLAKHAVSLQHAESGAGLDNLEVVVDSDTNMPTPYLHSTLSTSDIYSSAPTVVHPILPNPYVLDRPPPTGHSSTGITVIENGSSSEWASVVGQQQTPCFLSNIDAELDLYSADTSWEDLQSDLSARAAASAATEGSLLWKHAAVQTCQESVRSVAVNTEYHKPLELCPGDINKTQKENKMLEKRLEKMAKDFDQDMAEYEDDLAVLRSDIQNVRANKQVTNKELSLFQQKLEDEVKQDQKEKKANQEVLRSLKAQIEELTEEQKRLVQNIQEKKASYEAKFNESIDLNNQSAAEKMSLEDEIKRCKTLMASATRKSHTAQVSEVESNRDKSLYVLNRQLADTKAFLNKVEEAADWHPNQALEVTRSSCSENVREIEKKISVAETLYREQFDRVKKGRRVTELPSGDANNQPEAAAAPLPGAEGDPAPLSSHSSTPPFQASAASAQLQRKPPGSTVFDKAMERLTAMFPDYTRSDMMKFVQELRSSSGGSLSSMNLQDMVGGVTQLILDHQEKQSSTHINGHAAPYVIPVWRTPEPQRPTPAKALNVEDPCIICHEDMSPDDMRVLECRHSFHNQCIKSWLKEQNTCPTCRDHALLPEDFPALSARRRL